MCMPMMKLKRAYQFNNSKEPIINVRVMIHSLLHNTDLIVLWRCKAGCLVVTGFLESVEVFSCEPLHFYEAVFLVSAVETRTRDNSCGMLRRTLSGDSVLHTKLF